MATKTRNKEEDKLWNLESAEARNRLYKTFDIPSRDVRESLTPGYFAKLIFVAKLPPAGERMWVEIRKKTKTGYVGVLKNTPVALALKDILLSGDEVIFGPEHIVSISPPEKVEG
jgi:hypothetical protein